MSRRSLRDRVQSQSLRAGSVRVAVGLAFYGGSTYVFLAIAARVLGAASYADFAVFWGLVYGVGLGATYPFEQEVSRRTSLGREHGTSELGVLRAAYRLGFLVVAAVALLLLPVLPHLTHTGFVEALPLWGVTVAAVAGLAAAYVSRGALSGRRRFGAYAGQLGIEGAVRLVVALLLAWLAVTSPWPWALVVTVALLVAVVLTARSGRTPPTSVPDLPVRELVVSMAAVGISSIIAQSLVNLGPVVVRVLSGPADQELSGRFLAAALVARLPIFAFAAVQAVLMPHLVEAVVRKDAAGFTHSLRRVLLATTGLGALGVLLCAAAGPQLLRVLLGPDFELPQRDIVLLAVSIALFLGTLVLQPACLALRQHWRAAGAWVAAGATFGLATVAPLSPLLTVELALIAACAVALGGLSLAVARGLRTL
ncbi:Membrane protein involved in the export of O-antigen and teichoic acid [Pedococcus cremeus]|uniref:Membrane protein involved in the export of O-antigen and teichoic acid n=1 Tax=Pedococcus cremeus TaxID=587636 RepID=A0A1H9XAM1_9MICO|nr:hypothetical protein [Pedococcus cremeus]SES43220.1 Membrane protein involved in the export of O-antigen and teichoic acid [Pedococcus cremeus]